MTVRTLKSKLRAGALIPYALILLAVSLNDNAVMAGEISDSWVYPRLASTNSRRWLRILVNVPSTEGLTYLSFSGASAADGIPSVDPARPGQRHWIGSDGSFQSFTTIYTRQAGLSPYVTVHSSGANRWYTVGPFVGRRNMFNEPPAHYPWVLGYVYSPGSNTDILSQITTPTFYTDSGYYTLSNGEPIDRDSNDYMTGIGYQTVHDNDDMLEWFSGNAAGIDPVSVAGIQDSRDSGGGSSSYIFRVVYRSGLYSGLDLQPRWRSDVSFADGHSNGPSPRFPNYHLYDGSLGSPSYPSPRSDPSTGGSQFNWLYGRTTDPWLDQTGYARTEYDARGATEPEIILVIDGQHWAPHYMMPESPSNSDWSNGAVFRYEIRPTDYLRFVDNLFLAPFDLPGADTWDNYAVRLAGTPASNNYVALAAGPHTYEFWATDDYAPADDRAWVQVGWPGNDCHVEYIERIAPEPRRVDGLRSAIRRSRYSLFNELSTNGTGVPYATDSLRRFLDTSVDQPDPYGYTLKSHAASTNADIATLDNLDDPDPVLSLRKLPNVNPVLTAHPFFGLPGREGGITLPLPAILGGPGDPEQWAGGYMDNDIPNNQFIPGADVGALANPFPWETSAGPQMPWKYTNDDTILPNLVNIWNELSATPFRGGKWTESTKFTFRINYWHSENTKPSYMRVFLRRNDPDSSPGQWFGYTMESIDTDGDYTNGAVYQYEATPDQLPSDTSSMGGGIGEYNYYFAAADKDYQTSFPNRPDQYVFADENNTTRSLNDPGDIGVPSSATGEDYYWFRVNQKPILSSASVSPTVGRTGDPFSFRITYTDVDGEASVAGALGDRPFISYLYVDLFSAEHGQHSVTADPTSQAVLAYSNTGLHVFPDNELAGLFIVMESGAGVRKVYRIIGNSGNTINLEPDPNDPDHPGRLLTDGVVQGDLLQIAQRTAMTKADTSDNDYTDGVEYVFTTGTNMLLGPGNHRYFFEFADDWGGWQFPNNVDVHVEGEYVRFPNAGSFSGPEVIRNTAPELVDFRFLPQDVGSAPDGTTSTTFIFYVTYIDQQNDPPAFIRAELDGATTLSLYPDDANDNVYTDGVVYRSAGMRITEGQHFLRAQASDGEERYPPPAAYSGTALPFMGPVATVTGAVAATTMEYAVRAATFADGRYDGAGITIRMLDGGAQGNTYTILANAGPTLSFAAGTTLSGDGVATGDHFILDAAPGPNVVPNTPPQLIFPANDNLYENDPADPDFPQFPGLDPDSGVPSDPASGTQATDFTYQVIYIDNDEFAGVRGNPPEYVQVYVDNVPYLMNQVDPQDNDFTDDGSGTGGTLFEFTVPSGSVPALEAGTPHTYFFIGSDGLDTARLPALGTVTNNRYDGPIVDGRPDPPQQLFVTDTPNDNGETLDFTFSASLDDGGGADDVTEYHLYRNSSGAPFQDPPVLVIEATNAPSYAGQDTQATGLQKAVNYYYIVRAYDGPSIDPDGDGLPGVDADNDGQPDDPVVIDPLDQSLDSNQEGPVMAEDDIPPGAVPFLNADDPELGGTIELDWGASPDDGAGNDDVAEYRLYRNTSGAPYNAPPLVTLPAQTMSYQDQAVQDGVEYYYAIAVWDGANLSALVEATPAPVMSTDGAAPTISNLQPANAEADVSPGADIEFDVTDTGAGIDQSSLVVTVSVGGQPWTGTTTTTGAGSQLHVVFDPDTDFGFLVAVDVHIEISDQAVPTANTALVDSGFTVAGPPVYEIQGTIVDKDDPQVKIADVVVRAYPVGGGPAISATTDVDGNYTITGLAAGTYLAVPQKAGFAFIPEASVPLTVPPSPQRADFTAAPGFDITGTVTDANGDPLVGVRVTDGVHEDLTDVNGEYAIIDVAEGDYTVMPQLAGYDFVPPSQDVSVSVALGDAVADFAGDVEKFSVSGTVRTSVGLRLAGVTVEAVDVGDNVVGTADTTASGAYFVADLPAGFYTMRASKTGWEFDPATRDVDIAGDKTGIDFIAVPIYEMTLASGLRMVALPILPQNLNPTLNVPAGVNVARWDPTLPDTVTDKYIIGDPGSPLPEQYEMVPGRSFWMRNSTGAAVDLAVAGQPVDTSIPFSMSVKRGWNMSGNMFDGPLAWANLQIVGGQTVRDYGFLYNATTNSYDLVTDMAGLGTTTTVPKNAGFWLKADAARTVMVSSVGTADAQTSELKLADDDYLISIAARADRSADTCSVAGVVAGSGGYRFDNPPAISPYVDVYFVDERGSCLACDVRSASGDTQKWDFVVATDMTSAKVEVSLPDLSGVPADKSVTLVDQATGKRMYARTMSSYTYTAEKAGARPFTLEVGPRTEDALVVKSATAQQTGAGAVVTYSVSAGAQVSAAVLNVAGRTVRLLATGVSAQQGANTLSWDLRSSSGSRVPAGRYIVRITAVAENGQAASGVAGLQVNR